eukprot:m51a1_g1084 hypothetical protein (1174) ;mRNA; r:28867-34882
MRVLSSFALSALIGVVACARGLTIKAVDHSEAGAVNGALLPSLLTRCFLYRVEPTSHSGIRCSARLEYSDDRTGAVTQQLVRRSGEEDFSLCPFGPQDSKRFGHNATLELSVTCNDTDGAQARASWEYTLGSCEDTSSTLAGDQRWRSVCHASGLSPALVGACALCGDSCVAASGLSSDDRAKCQVCGNSKVDDGEHCDRTPGCDGTCRCDLSAKRWDTPSGGRCAARPAQVRIDIDATGLGLNKGPSYADATTLVKEFGERCLATAQLGLTTHSVELRAPSAAFEYEGDLEASHVWVDFVVEQSNEASMLAPEDQVVKLATQGNCLGKAFEAARFPGKAPSFSLLHRLEREFRTSCYDGVVNGDTSAEQCDSSALCGWDCKCVDGAHLVGDHCEAAPLAVFISLNSERSPRVLKPFSAKQAATFTEAFASECISKEIRVTAHDLSPSSKTIRITIGSGDYAGVRTPEAAYVSMDSGLRFDCIRRASELSFSERLQVNSYSTSVGTETAWPVEPDDVQPVDSHSHSNGALPEPEAMAATAEPISGDPDTEPIKGAEHKGAIRLAEVSDVKRDGALLMLQDKKRVWKVLAESEDEALSWHAAVLDWMHDASRIERARAQAGSRPSSPGARDALHDLCVRATSMRDLCAGAGWRLKFGGTRADCEVVHALRSGQHRVFAVDGGPGAGRTHLMRGLSGLLQRPPQDPQQQQQHHKGKHSPRGEAQQQGQQQGQQGEGAAQRQKEGLYMRVPERARGVVLVDSVAATAAVAPGCALADRRAADHFVRALKLSAAHCVAVVVRRASAADQELVCELRRAVRASTTVVVVHNFADVASKEQLLAAIHSDVVCVYCANFDHKSANGIEAPYWTSQTRDGPIMHCVLANEDSEAGRDVNGATYELLRATSELAGEPVSVCERLEQLSNDLIDNYVDRGDDASARLVWDWEQKALEFGPRDGSGPTAAKFTTRPIASRYMLLQPLYLQHCVMEHPQYALAIKGEADAALADCWVEITVAAPGCTNINVVHTEQDPSKLIIMADRFMFGTAEQNAVVIERHQEYGRVRFPVQLPFDVNPRLLAQVYPAKFDGTNGVLCKYKHGLISVWVPKSSSVVRRVPAPPGEPGTPRIPAQAPPSVAAAEEAPMIPAPPPRGMRGSLTRSLSSKWEEQFLRTALFLGVKW